MALEAKATITGNKDGTRLRIYIPKSLSLDSAFPFKKGEVIKIDNCKGRFTVEKLEHKS